MCYHLGNLLVLVPFLALLNFMYNQARVKVPSGKGFGCKVHNQARTTLFLMNQARVSLPCLIDKALQGVIFLA